jgi:hypothetical protein
MVYDISREMVQSGSSGFSQIDREELDDEQIIILSSYLVMLLGAQKRHGKRALRTVRPKCLGTGPFGAKAAFFMIVTAPSMWVQRAWLELRTIIPWAMPSEHQRF